MAAILCIYSATLALPLSGFRTVIVGGGPSGLLLAHRLLDAGGTVSLVEGRPDPRTEEYAKEGRAYALGLGLRGRTAIRTVDEPLWAAVRDAGFESDRFTLRIGSKLKLDLRTPDDSNSEPSVLIYQSELCAALLAELERRHGVGGRLSTTFEARVTECDAVRGSVAVDAAGGAMSLSADCIAGCDGVNSIVRAGMERAASAFSAELQALPGNLKVVRLDAVPPPLAPDAVSVVPGSPVSAFIEPTKGGACALISWRDGGSGVDPAEVSDPDEAANLLASSLSLIGESFNTTEIGAQFVDQRPARAATVKCNSYHAGKAVLLGDAAHSTGGASGQGCNSALGDAAALATLLEREAEAAAGATEAAIASALRAYSSQRVPEGQALLELSIGPSKPGPLRKALGALSTAVGAVLNRFGLGEPPLQTELTTSLTPFVELRKKRDKLYGEPWPDPREFEATIAEVERSVAG